MNTVKPAAEKTGLSQACWRRWISERRVNYVRLGRAIMIADTEIERLIVGGTVPARVNRNVRA